MKLSLKFFCIAYIIVLLSTGAGGFFIIKSVNDTVWKAQTDRVSAAAYYAADSFIALSESIYIETDTKMRDLTQQIKSVLDSAVNELTIYTPQTVKKEYADLKDNEGLSLFFEGGGRLYMESVCRVKSGTQVYYVAVRSDFTEIKNQQRRFWSLYGVTVFTISAVSGLLLFLSAKKITYPLKRLARASDEIALGNYGKTVDVKGSDNEISALSKSFNTMSLAVEQNIKEIKEDGERRDRFVSDFSHELKTPMTAIIGYAQLLDSYELEPQERKEAAQAVYGEAKRLERLSRQMLDLYILRNESTEFEEIGLSEIEKQLKTTLEFLSEKYRVPFSVDLGTETVFANRELLISLLYNLADNAFKASEPESPIEIYSALEDGRVKITVRDRGRGIAKENLQLLTEPFYREDKSRSRAQGGAGLGLSLCKEIAEIHGTSLCFESEKGKGTAVSFALRKGGAENENT